MNETDFLRNLQGKWKEANLETEMALDLLDFFDQAPETEPQNGDTIMARKHTLSGLVFHNYEVPLVIRPLPKIIFDDKKPDKIAAAYVRGALMQMLRHQQVT